MIILSCDHAGFEYMEKLQKFFKRNNLDFAYFGPKSFNAEDDYPDFVIPASQQVLKDKNNIGIFMCGSGIGVNIVANRFKGIRSVNATNSTMAEMARKHEDANVLTLGARYMSYKKSLEIIKTFLNTKFEGGRHLRRISKY